MDNEVCCQCGNSIDPTKGYSYVGTGDHSPALPICLDCTHINGMAKVEDDKSEFTKFDDGKLMMSLIDPDFILGVADVLTFGANKYSKNNWQKVTDIDRYKDSFLRHVYAYLNGELIDSDSGKPHLDCIATNAMFLRYFEHGKGSS